MIHIEPVKAFSDNYIWALINAQHGQIVVIDPGDAVPITNFIEANQLELTEIWVTHKHADHTGGIKKLRELYPLAQVIADKAHGVIADQIVQEGSILTIWGYNVQVWKIAGHTENHLAYLLNMEGLTHVFCGDTLFSAGCGRVFTGNMSAMYDSLMRLNSLSLKTLFYPAHEYTASNLRFGLHIEPNNKSMKTWLAKVEKMREDDKPSLPTTLEVERLINVFLRLEEKSIIDAVFHDLGVTSKDPLSIFTALRKYKDDYA